MDNPRFNYLIAAVIDDKSESQWIEAISILQAINICDYPIDTIVSALWMSEVVELPDQPSYA